MKKAIGILLLITAALSGCRKSEIDLALESLDATIAAREATEAQFKARLESWRAALAASPDKESKCRLYDSLFTAFRSYNLDSASHYLKAKLDYARRNGLRKYELKSTLDLSNIKDVKTLDKSIAAFNSIPEEEAGEYGLKEYRYYCGYSLYSFAARARNSEKEHYSALSDRYRDLYLECGSDSYEHALLESKKMAQEGRQTEIPALLLSAITDSTSEKNKASAWYNVAQVWDRLGDSDLALLYYIRSADADFKRPAHRYISLTAVSERLAGRGDARRASEYIKIAVDDVLASKSISFLSSTTAAMVKITGAVSAMEKRQKALLSLIVLLTVLLALLMALMFRSSRRQSARISELNRRLTQTNTELEIANKVRATYLGNYMTKCASYIGMVDENVHKLRKQYVSEGLDSLLASLKKPSFSDEEYKRFYEEFNLSFNNVFPGFTAKVNEIMLPGHEFSEDPGKPTPIDLMILKVYHLGLVEYKDIAKFLNCALTTVYTYKTRTKRNSRLRGKEFDAYILNINV